MYSLNILIEIGFFINYISLEFMALPMDDGFVPYDENSERAMNVDSYRITCIDFIKDISHDYLAWVDRYKLPRMRIKNDELRYLPLLNEPMNGLPKFHKLSRQLMW